MPLDWKSTKAIRSFAFRRPKPVIDPSEDLQQEQAQKSARDSKKQDKQADHERSKREDLPQLCKPLASMGRLLADQSCRQSMPNLAAAQSIAADTAEKRDRTCYSAMHFLTYCAHAAF
jgi:hypothetical protein